jgi:flagellar M-ring protein FliF
MTLFSQLWSRLDRWARIGLVVSVLLLALAMAVASYWLLRTDYQLLFGDLSAPDAAAMTAELDRMKTPYRIESDGSAIMVPAEQVYKTRLKLVGRDLPLHGTVGFELFNNADIGMTEFAQKVNYQRALQGELTRTILSIEEIQAARVHLALPEQSLFKKSSAQAKASVSITLKAGKILHVRQVQGIQRLVAASVPEVREADVTVIDQHGVALTRASTNGSDVEVVSGEGNLDNKEALERYLNRKVTEVLDRTFGAGQSIASVDVAFTRDQVKVTTENVLGATPAAAAGVMVREHQTAREPAADAGAAGPTGTVIREVDYQVGRRVEQTVSAPGAVGKINVAVVVRKPLDAEQIGQVREVVGMAVGIDKKRGDGVAVYSIVQLNGDNAVSPTIMPSVINGDAAAQAVGERVAPATTVARPTSTVVTLLMALIVIVLAVAWGIRVRGQRQPTAALSVAEREALLARVRGWIAQAPGGGV